ncbi:hypothetical protein KV112_17765 [Mycolicibacter sp. MYC123]|uniref:Uncharacterized protein n=1 Tax=[Mycobacterium] zoologicum TaxID=2872311 RepID=A0ABU5YNB8_9MYCO|nr:MULTISPECIES: hypothetical protein [unclassified Mycolicibacter]MEB3051562.1 hypothetical protein [Mycolicibacter sp. MYC123]MEB3061384.1 hypothetical protein [Mycolicibacter sp. MYC101]
MVSAHLAAAVHAMFSHHADEVMSTAHSWHPPHHYPPQLNDILGDSAMAREMGRL